MTTPTTLGARERYVDLFRGLLIAHMAFDHASLMFNGGRGREELAALAPDPPAGVAAALLRVKTGLAGTTLVWLLLLAAMVWPCRWYFRKKRERPNAVTRWI